MEFRSQREKNFWIASAVTVVIIFATIGLSTSFVGFIEHWGLLTPLFLAGMVLVGLTVLVAGIDYRPGGIELMIILGAAALYFLLFIRMSVPQERTHLIEYGVLSVFIFEAISERNDRGRIIVSAVAAIALSSLIGILDELIQIWVPHRYFDPIDILFNFLASLMSVSVVGVIRMISRKQK